MTPRVICDECLTSTPAHKRLCWYCGEPLRVSLCQSCDRADNCPVEPIKTVTTCVEYLEKKP